MSEKESSSDAESPKPEESGKKDAAKKAAKKSPARKAAAKKEAPLPDLSSLNFGPAWAKDKPKKERSNTHRRSDSGGGEQQRSSGRRQDDRRGGNDRRDQRRGGQGDRRSQGQNRGRGDRRQDSRGRQQGRPPLVPAPEGMKARIMPIEEGLDAMAKQISATGRTHSVFDLAWLVLGGLERFHMIFESEKEPLYRSRSDHSLWLFQKECLDHFWNSGGLTKYYDEEIIEVEPPSGNFQSVARCGISRTLIGPPNHHAYQQTIMDLHREKFSNMPLEKYKQKIVMEHGEEAVQEWLEGMKKHVRWRPKTITSEVPEEAGTPEALEGEEPAEATPPAIEETIVILDNRREVEQHFIANGFEQEYESGKNMSVLANMPAKMISPGLSTLQKNTITEARRYPGDLASMLCRQMSGRHLAVFKWKKRLHCGPARPKHLPDDLVMADRPTALFNWVTENPAGNIDAMWKELLPKDIDDETRHLWYHDLHWLINEGFILLFSDGTLHAAKELEKPAKKPAAKKTAKAEGKAGTPPAAAAEPPAELTKAIEGAEAEATDKTEEPPASPEPEK